MDFNATLRETRHTLGKSATLKLFVISGLALALLIPITMVKALIDEREQRKEEVIEEISGKWGRPQTITGPVISIPYKKYFTDQDGRKHHTTEYFHLMPDSLDIKSTMTPEIRYRGMYEAVLYASELLLLCSFKAPELQDLEISPEDVVWSGAMIGVGISDMGGIKERIVALHESESIEINPGHTISTLIHSGVSAHIRMDGVGTHHFSILLKLNGSQQIQFAPVGKSTTVMVKSTWQAPSFVGDFLPVARQIGKEGFEARWNVLYLNRNYPQQWKGDAYNLDQSLFGVKLYKQVDVYQKSMRTAKYALLFIAFTFYAFFLSEILSQLSVHPVQYLLIGFAMIIFYTLLLSFSEQIGFNRAYMISSTAVIILIMSYTRSISRRKSVTLMVGCTLGLLYGYCFILLQLEDYALLMGSIGLFAALAVIMYLTRKVNWYALCQRIKPEAPQANETIDSRSVPA
ncbi:MAG: cell envelope integrity protein CreD [Desulfobacteraceae bacterium]|nr:cell envelope integrity protein CreD [Desulfobacteraceae bacterium]